MSYPWAGFGPLLFEGDEGPVFGSDTGWNRVPSLDRARPLGSTRDSVVTLALGSFERSFEVYLTPTRATFLESLLATAATFTDWDRPDPDSRSALLSAFSRMELVKASCAKDGTLSRWHCRVTLVSL